MPAKFNQVDTFTIVKSHPFIHGVEIDIVGSNADDTALRHGVTGIQRQIQDHLLHLTGVRLDVGELRLEMCDQFDLFPDRTAQQILHVLHQLVQVDRLRRGG